MGILRRNNKLADLIININLEECRKKKAFVIETYEGKIPHLKSKKFSGQLRKVNLSSLFNVDNLTSIELQNIKNIFNDENNTQISKHQYIFSVNKINYIKNIVSKNIVFCKYSKKSAMYEIKNIFINTDNDRLECYNGFSAFQDTTSLYINYDINKSINVKNTIIPLFYIDIISSEYTSELFFDYGNDLIKFDEKETFLKNDEQYRNYKFEKEIISIIKEAHWKNAGREKFIYVGKNIYDDIHKLEVSGIHLYTNTRKKISVASFDNVNVSYGIDWFELNGTASVGDINIALCDLIDFRKGKENWTEYDGQIVFTPNELKKLKGNGIEKNGNSLRISKEDILMALEAVDIFDSGNVVSYNKLSEYQDVKLQLPEILNKTLREYQRTGVRWLLSLRKNGFGGCLADDMGLGKTLQVIAYLSDKSLEKNQTLIVVPKTLVQNWNREFRKFAPKITTFIYHGTGRCFNDALKYNVVITTYGTLLNDIEKFVKCRFDNLILDEAQNIKNSRSKTNRAVRLVNAKTKIIMTGTPLENNIQEYWGLMKIVNPTHLSYQAITKGLSEAQVIEKVRRLTKSFILRRYKKDVLDDLPEKEEQIIYCSFDEPQRQLYNNMLESIKYEINRKSDRYEIKSNAIALNGLKYLQEICCHPDLISKEYNKNHCRDSAKLDQLLMMVNELYMTGHKIVVFSSFTRMLGIINKELTKRHFNIFYLDGKTTNRQNVVDEFEKSNDGVFLISLKAGGVGLNLVSADTAIIYDPWWNPAVEKQAEDRIYRIGQKRKVTVFKLIVADTIEEKVRTLQETKKRIFDEVTEGHELPINISMEDIRNLLK